MTSPASRPYKIFRLSPGDTSPLEAIAGQRDNYDLSALEQYEQRLRCGDICLLIAKSEAGPCGYALLNRKPKYKPYKRLGIPEIQDVYVDPGHRRKGIATALIKASEDIARENDAEFIGISVGVSSRYGAAQKLYASLGFEPDGHGVTYDRAPVSEGEVRPVDGHLCLMLLKSLAA